MHIPDGFLSPITYLPACAAAAGAWAWAARGLRDRLDENVVARLAAFTALIYALGLVMVPIPGGTSGHLIGVALLALLFGARLAFLAYSVVLLLQSLLFGAGGITALPVNALAMGLAASAVAVGVYQALRRVNEPAAVLIATWLSVMVAALLVALVLGAQPLLAHSGDGHPLFFPFGWSVTLPAVLLPHALLGFAEALVTLMVWRYAKRRRWSPA